MHDVRMTEETHCSTWTILTAHCSALEGAQASETCFTNYDFTKYGISSVVNMELRLVISVFCAGDILSVCQTESIHEQCW